MRLANSPYYGLSRRIGSASRAVVLLGFSAVRALAVSAAYGLLVDESSEGLPGFWTHSVSAAVGASCVARIAGAPMNDAFSAGLLHDVGLGLGALTEERLHLFNHCAFRYRRNHKSRKTVGSRELRVRPTTE